MKWSKKLQIKISNKQQFECVGLSENVISCPYYISTIKCVSKEGLVRRIDRDELFRTVSCTDNAVLGSAGQTLLFLSQRLEYLLAMNKISIPEAYYKLKGMDEIKIT
jgi:hypothetical protein